MTGLLILSGVLSTVLLFAIFLQLLDIKAILKRRLPDREDPPDWVAGSGGRRGE